LLSVSGKEAQREGNKKKNKKKKKKKKKKSWRQERSIEPPDPYPKAQG